MPKKLYHVNLTVEEKAELHNLIRKGKSAARKITRARILLLADTGKKDDEIMASLQTARSTVERTRKQFIEGGVEWAINEKPRPGGQPKLDAKAEATLIALACSDAPTGQSQWTMQLLADRLVELDVVDSISDETVRRYLKKTI
jgi:transposase